MEVQTLAGPTKLCLKPAMQPQATQKTPMDVNLIQLLGARTRGSPLFSLAPPWDGSSWVGYMARVPKAESAQRRGGFVRRKAPVRP